MLCRVKGSLHVHDNPSFYGDVKRHENMGWTMAETCQRPDDTPSSGDPGMVKPTILDLTTR